jgi:hypothetical protein
MGLKKPKRRSLLLSAGRRPWNELAVFIVTDAGHASKVGKQFRIMIDE